MTRPHAILNQLIVTLIDQVGGWLVGYVLPYVIFSRVSYIVYQHLGGTKFLT